MFHIENPKWKIILSFMLFVFRVAQMYNFFAYYFNSKLDSSNDRIRLIFANCKHISLNETNLSQNSQQFSRHWVDKLPHTDHPLGGFSCQWWELRQVHGNRKLFKRIITCFEFLFLFGGCFAKRTCLSWSLIIYKWNGLHVVCDAIGECCRFESVFWRNLSFDFFVWILW